MGASGGARLQLCPCLPGPAFVHPECAPAGQRPALLQTLQRQPAPRHREALGTACSPPGDKDSCRCHCTTSACCRRSLPGGPRPLLGASHPERCHLPPPCSTPCSCGTGTGPRVSEPWQELEVLGAGGAAGPGTREAPGNPAGWSVRIMRVSVTRQKRQGQP